MSKSNSIEPPQKPTLKLVGGGKDKSGNALSPYGPLRAGLTTSQRIKEDRALTESLNYLESEVATLESRYYTACATLVDVLARLVKVGAFTNATLITEEENNV